MPNFDALNESAEIQVELVTLAGVEKITAKEGMTVKEFKEANNLVGTKMIDDNSDVLRDSDIIEEGMQIYVSTPKKNG
jgi:LysM repeat protein